MGFLGRLLWVLGAMTVLAGVFAWLVHDAMSNFSLSLFEYSRELAEGDPAEPSGTSATTWLLAVVGSGAAVVWMFWRFFRPH